MNRVTQPYYQAMVRDLGHGFVEAAFERIIRSIVLEGELELCPTVDMSRTAHEVTQQLLPPHLWAEAYVQLTRKRLDHLKVSIVIALDGRFTKQQEGWV